MALSDFERHTISRLANTIVSEASRLKVFGDYYNGKQALEQLGIAIPEELRRFTVIVNWPRVVADALEERIDLEGFRLPSNWKRDPTLWSIWQRNGLDELSQLAHLDAIIYGRSYICIGANEDDAKNPLVTVESPMEMYAEVSPRTRKVTAALRHYMDLDENGKSIRRAVLYLPNETIWVRWGSLPSSTRHSWVEEDRDQHGLGIVPVVPIVNRARVGDYTGVSEIEDVIDLTDAAARALTLAQLATEILSAPQRAVLGAREEDFVDPDGKVLPKWQAYIGQVWALENEDAKVHQFSAADLGNFEKILSVYAAKLSSVTGLPLRYFGINQANPASEGAIVADESRVIKRAERRHRSWGGSWEEGARVIKLFRDGAIPDSYYELECIWRDPATPTEAQLADAVVKKVQAGILPIEAAWEELGYSQTRIEALRKMREADLQATDVLARQLNAYRSGVTEDPGANGTIAGATEPAAGAE